METTWTIEEIARIVQGRVEGDAGVVVDGVGSLQEARPGQITFVSDAKRVGELSQCRASAALVAEGAPVAPVADSTAPAMTLVRVKDVQTAVAALLERLDPGDDLPPVGVHASSVVASSAVVSADVRVGPFVVIGERAVVAAGCVLSAGVKIGADVILGEGCVLFENAVIRWGCRLGRRVRVGPGSVIGYDGFGYTTQAGRHVRVRHVGVVEIEDDVDLGACTCVDRAKFGVTRIGTGSKIDNLVQVAHNIQMGRGCILAAQVGLAGSSRLGHYVVMGGQVGVADHLTVGDGVQLGAQAGVMKDVPAGDIQAGTPAIPIREVMRQIVQVGKLSELQRRVKELESKL